MDKRHLNKREYELIEKEVGYYADSGIIDSEQRNRIISLYSIGRDLNFVRILVTVGSILIGLGFLSFIASNWKRLDEFMKFAIMFGAFLASMGVAYKLEEDYFRIGRSILYISGLIYGAGIFLIGQTFNLGGHFTSAFLMWGIGILPMAVLFSDKLIFIFSHILLIVYLNGLYDYYTFPYLMAAIVPLLYYLNRYLGNSKIGTFFTNVLLINSVITIGYKFNLEGAYTGVVVFAAGAAMYIFCKKDYNPGVFRISGLIAMGFSGIFLTYKEVWQELSYVARPQELAIAIGIALIMAFLWLTSKGNITALVFVCLIILRYYFDALYDFMPKSLFFTGGGLILIGFGYYFERMRRREAENEGHE